MAARKGMYQDAGREAVGVVKKKAAAVSAEALVRGKALKGSVMARFAKVVK